MVVNAISLAAFFSVIAMVGLASRGGSLSGPGKVMNFVFAVGLGMANSFLICYLAKLPVFSKDGITNVFASAAVACVVLFFIAAFGARTWTRKR